MTAAFAPTATAAANVSFQPLVPDRQDREIRRRREIGEAGHARVAFDLAR